MTDEYLDPAVVARYADITARHRAVMAQLAEEHEREVAELRRASAERDERTNDYLDKLSAAVQRRDRTQEAEQPHRWPERGKKNLVLSFGDGDEQPPSPPPPPAPRPTPPEPPAPERPRERRVLSFGEDEDQLPAPKPIPKPKAPEPQPSNSDRAGKGRVLNFSTEDDEEEGFQGFRRRR